MSLNSSFAEAEWTLQQAHPDQTPWLDDNGNGIPNEVEDGQEAARRGFAYAGTFDYFQWPPYISAAVVRQEEGLLKAQVQAEAGEVVSSTWALIYPPSYQPPPPGEDMVRDEDDPNVAKVLLEDWDGDGIFTAYTSFWEPGTYRVVIYAVDERGLGARPREAEHEVVNHAPATPYNPVPYSGAANVRITQRLSWQSSDIDGDPVAYSVAFGPVYPPPVVATGVTTTTYDPGVMALDTTYYWAITATDGLSTTAGPIWNFRTTAEPNRAPHTPANPTPADGATGVPTDQVLQWHGGDPDGDPVAYSVAFGQTSSPPLVEVGLVVPTYDPGLLISDTTYYWTITATDGLSVSVGGPWHFTTGVSTTQDYRIFLPLAARNRTSAGTLDLPVPPERAGAIGQPVIPSWAWFGDRMEPQASSPQLTALMDEFVQVSDLGAHEQAVGLGYRDQ